MNHHSYSARPLRRALSMAALALAAIAGAGARASAQTPPRPVQRIDFDDAVALALRQNPGVLQARNATAAEAAVVRQQRLQFLPSFSLNTSTGQSYGRSFSQSEGAIVDRTTNSMSAGVSSSVTVFDGLSNVQSLRSARASEEASTRDLARVRQTAVFTVASNFLALVAQQEQLRVQSENLAALEAQEAQIRRFVTAGTRPISDLFQQQANVAGARAQVVDARRALELAKVDLMQTLQLDATGRYEFVAPAVQAADTTRAYDIDSLVARALASRVDVDADQARVEAARADVKAAQGGYWPSVAVTAGYNTAYSSASEIAFADQLDQRRGGSIGLGISVPLFDRGSTALAAQRARLQEENARLALSTRRQQVALEVRRAWLDHQAAQERLKAAEAAQAAADQAVAATQKRYEVGAATLVELTQARASQVQAASAVVGARYTLIFQQALMTYYTGEMDPARVTLGG